MLRSSGIDGRPASGVDFYRDRRQEGSLLRREQRRGRSQRVVGTFSVYRCVYFRVDLADDAFVLRVGGAVLMLRILAWSGAAAIAADDDFTIILVQVAVISVVCLRLGVEMGPEVIDDVRATHHKGDEIERRGNREGGAAHSLRRRWLFADQGQHVAERNAMRHELKKQSAISVSWPVFKSFRFVFGPSLGALQGRTPRPIPNELTGLPKLYPIKSAKETRPLLGNKTPQKSPIPRPETIQAVAKTPTIPPQANPIVSLPKGA